MVESVPYFLRGGVASDHKSQVGCELWSKAMKWVCIEKVHDIRVPSLVCEINVISLCVHKHFYNMLSEIAEYLRIV